MKLHKAKLGHDEL